MCDYREWCRLCGSLEGSATISENVLEIAGVLMELAPENIKICFECNQNLIQVSLMVERAKSLNRLFEGLMEENLSDLSVKRLNAYRAHFNLLDMIQEPAVQIICQGSEESEECEYVEYGIDESDIIKEEETIIESIEEMDSSMIVEEETLRKEDFEIDGEVYVEDIETSYLFEEIESQKSTSKVDDTEKTEDEKLFNFQCHVCSYRPEFMKMKQLVVHCKKFHGCLPQVKCCSEECESVLSTWRRLMIHKEKHFPNYERLRCPECEKVYMTEVGLENHRKTHTKRFICPYCGKNFKESKTLRWHEATHLKSIEERKTHECPYPDCGIRFISKQACQNHIGSKHEKVINCVCKVPDCGKCFYTKKSFHEHMTNSHSERKFFCDQCNFKARTKAALNTHKDIHRDGKMYSCDLCSDSFNAYRRLKAHMICHSDETPYQCHYCESAFKRTKDLKSHILVHTKERPFNCQFCSRKFANAANCRKHKLKDHPIELKNWESVNGIGGRKNLVCYK